MSTLYYITVFAAVDSVCVASHQISHMMNDDKRR